MTPEPLLKPNVVKAASSIAVLAGIWLFISPWIYGFYTVPDAWNCWIVGFFIVLFGAIRLASSPIASWVSWINCALGVWTFASPWIYAYIGDRGRLINSLAVGVIVFIAAICSANAVPRMVQPTLHHT